MTGITSFGAYIPYYRLAHKEIARAWGGRAGDAERAVANVDEDTITMSVEAVRDLLNGRDGNAVDGLIFASTTSPYLEKQASTVIVTAADLRRDIRSADQTNSTRASTTALRSALDAVGSGNASRVIVAASDQRMGQPRSANERIFGDAAAAVEVGTNGVIAKLLAAHSTVDEITDFWRSSDESFTIGWEERFAISEGYLRVVRQTVKETFERSGIGPSQIAKAIFYAPDPGTLGAAAKGLGFSADQIPDHLFNSVGSTGTAMPLLVLSSVLPESRPGDKLLLVGYGNGCDALILEVTDEINSVRPRLGVSGSLAAKAPIGNYEQYARFSGFIETERQRRQAEQASAVQTWRDRDEIYRLYGQRCLNCNTIQYPSQRVCIECRAKDNFEEIKLADKQAEVFTFTHDFLNIDPNPPTVMAVVDFEGGGRACLQMTDRDPAQVKIGQKVEMTFRKLYEADGFKNYYWKCRPVR